MALKDKRLEFHEFLCDILGSRNVYFQPPETVKLQYPAIVYSRARLDKIPADNLRYLTRRGYRVTLITMDPDDSVLDVLMNFPYSYWNSHQVIENLNQDTFTIYY